MLQKATYDELGEAAGSYWVETGGRRLHVRTFDDIDPKTASWELTTREFKALLASDLVDILASGIDFREEVMRAKRQAGT